MGAVAQGLGAGCPQARHLLDLLYLAAEVSSERVTERPYGVMDLDRAIRTAPWNDEFWVLCRPLRAAPCFHGVLVVDSGRTVPAGLSMARTFGSSGLVLGGFICI